LNLNVHFLSEQVIKLLEEWPPNSSDLNPLDYHVWGAMLRMLSGIHAKTVQDCRILFG